MASFIDKHLMNKIVHAASQYQLALLCRWLWSDIIKGLCSHSFTCTPLNSPVFLPPLCLLIWWPTALAFLFIPLFRPASLPPELLRAVLLGILMCLFSVFVCVHLWSNPELGRGTERETDRKRACDGKRFVCIRHTWEKCHICSLWGETGRERKSKGMEGKQTGIYEPKEDGCWYIAEFPEGTAEYRDQHGTRNMVAGKLGSVQQNNYKNPSTANWFQKSSTFIKFIRELFIIQDKNTLFTFNYCCLQPL